MLTSFSEVLLTGIILVSTAYTAIKTPAIWHRYKERYGRVLVSVPLVGLLFGLAHIGILTPPPHDLLATVETGALLGVGIVVGAFGYIHPRLEQSGDKPR